MLRDDYIHTSIHRPWMKTSTTNSMPNTGAVACYKLQTNKASALVLFTSPCFLDNLEGKTILSRNVRLLLHTGRRSMNAGTGIQTHSVGGRV